MKKFILSVFIGLILLAGCGRTPPQAVAETSNGNVVNNQVQPRVVNTPPGYSWNQKQVDRVFHDAAKTAGLTEEDIKEFKTELVYISSLESEKANVKGFKVGIKATHAKNGFHINIRPEIADTVESIPAGIGSLPLQITDALKKFPMPKEKPNRAKKNQAIKDGNIRRILL